ncbi:MAG: EutN/CcmL family microcompartment protein [Calothrix sp. MO_192.B10]|nr:EutN/CcmL family microcompartment protein [Calothrix sp. MO_192.B10]MDJ0799463.1 EutN/CcmL family microcompartment protein [Calothrix sp. MO_167.B12]
MQIAKVRGTVVSTQKDPSLRGAKLLLLQFVDEEGQTLPNYEVAVDSVGAGVDEWVLISRGGNAARQVQGNDKRPIDAVVVAIIDTIYVENRQIYNKKSQDR